MVLKEAARRIFMNAVEAADPYLCIKNTVELDGDTIIIGEEEYPLSVYKNVYIVGGGKASARMGEAIEEILGDRITGGLINTKDGHKVPLKHIKVLECSHPVPDDRGVYGTRQIVNILSEADEQTLVICLLSGGGSALMPAPAEGITLQEKQKLTDLLLRSGGDINEINTVRKHISRIKGGRLAQIAYPARILSLILSDVVGDKLDSIASGPTAPDTTTFSDCIYVLKKYGLFDKIPDSIKTYLNENIEKMENETPKPGDPVFKTLL